MSSTFKPLVLVIGGTGTVGSIILESLAKTNLYVSWSLFSDMHDYNIKLQRLATSVRSKSLSKPQVASLSALGIEIRASDWQTDKPEKLDQLFSASDIVISTVNAEARLNQKILVDAAKRANVKRFIPCEFGIACVPGVIDLFDKVKSNLTKSLNGI